MSRPTAAIEYSRPALAPALLGAIVLMASFALIDGSWFLYVRYVVAILALIVCVFAWQANKRWWLVGFIAVAVLWNPVWPLPVGDLITRVLTLLAIVMFIIGGVLIKTPTGRSAAERQRYGRR